MNGGRGEILSSPILIHTCGGLILRKAGGFAMAGGINVGVPNPQLTKPPVEERRSVVKTKTLGRVGSSHEDSFNAKLEARRRDMQDKERRESDEQAAKHRDAILAKVGARRHLHYEVIEDAAIVQVSVINSEDGAVIRKVPPDNVVGFVKKFRASLRNSRLDMTL